MNKTENQSNMDIKSAVKDILDTIDREREREIIARRFGLYDRRETLEQIGELLGITRERVRQLEKAILARLKAFADEDKLPHISKVEKQFIMHLHELGRVARIEDLTARVSSENTGREQAHVTLLATLAPHLTLLEENDNYYQGVAITEYFEEEELKKKVEEIVEAVSKNGKPCTVEELYQQLSYEHPSHIQALASLSKKLASLQGQWGLVKWPTVNPKNIRDKIYVVLQQAGKPLHFSEISKKIQESNFRRKDVTTQAIHNELIKDKRFVLIGRGIYALDEWGYKRGTVADIISDVLRKEKGPLHRDEIVKRVLKHRQVKETTILLNLQGKPQFKRTAKATYDLANQS
ncbi:hypothetical protein DYH10_04140 [Candidatus Saccharibacteria bacterium CPR2]|nr:hypothetical protein [Candidatus Saccharibacteria bacterium CPR2]